MLVALQSWATYEFTQAIFDDTLPVPDLDTLDVTIWLTSSLDLPDAEEMSTPHLYEALSDRKKASVAIYGMLVRLARITFFANKSRFGLIVLEEAGGLLNSRAGASDAHLISRRARKHYTGLVIITQDPVADLELMGDKFITQQLIMPFESDELAREVAAAPESASRTTTTSRSTSWPSPHRSTCATPPPSTTISPPPSPARPIAAIAKATASSSTSSAAPARSEWPPNPTPSAPRLRHHPRTGRRMSTPTTRGAPDGRMVSATNWPSTRGCAGSSRSG